MPPICAKWRRPRTTARRTILLPAPSFWTTAGRTSQSPCTSDTCAAPSTLNDFTGYNSILADIKAVKDGNVWCTTPDFFQIADTIGSMINDINLMLNADADTSELTYLKKLK